MHFLQITVVPWRRFVPLVKALTMLFMFDITCQLIGIKKQENIIRWVIYEISSYKFSQLTLSNFVRWFWLKFFGRSP
ncbi:unnamed protein product [Lactuca virosa]|uniref:Secreted protein n=1 Tax=Lactuca virosa TaxID=75947 RepID=A0AAU9P3Q3_9ASTR|nr:unnamed protein product [Lactuca virosa]